MLRVALELTGHTVLEAADGAAALALGLGPGDVVLLDVMMPGVDGWEVLTRLRQRGTDCPRVLMLTAKSAEQDRQRALGMGAAGYLTKPFDIDEVLGAVERVLERTESDIARNRLEDAHLSRILVQVERAITRHGPTG